VANGSAIAAFAGPGNGILYVDIWTNTPRPVPTGHPEETKGKLYSSAELFDPRGRWF